MSSPNLPEEDTLYLSSSGRTWSLVPDGNNLLLIINSYTIPSGYTVTTSDLALQIIRGYPDTQIDMVYFSPALVRTNGASIPAIANVTLAGRNWQRWSRHRTASNPWRPGIDCVETHLAQVDEWLRRELSK